MLQISRGSPLEKQTALYCKQLVHILKKSKFFKGYVGQRKKRK